MEMTLNIGSFETLKPGEMFDVSGGGKIGDALQITAGTVLIAWAPIVGVAVAVSTVGGGTAAGVVIAATMISEGCAFIGNTVH